MRVLRSEDTEIPSSVLHRQHPANCSDSSKIQNQVSLPRPPTARVCPRPEDAGTRGWASLTALLLPVGAGESAGGWWPRLAPGGVQTGLEKYT